MELNERLIETIQSALDDAEQLTSSYDSLLQFAKELHTLVNADQVAATPQWHEQKELLNGRARLLLGED